MEVHTSKGLGRLKFKGRELANIALEEREEMELLMPNEFDIWLLVYNSEDMAYATNEGIGMNVLHFMNSYDTYIQKRLIMDYFDKFWSFRPWSEEEDIMLSLNKPEKAIEKFEESVQPWRVNDFVKHIRENSKEVKEVIKETLPKMVKSFIKSKNALNTIRHEIDHVAYLQAGEWDDTSRAFDKIHAPEGSLTRYGLAEAHMEYLEEIIATDPLTEQRAAFFDFIDVGNWLKIDIERLRMPVFKKYCDNYIYRHYIPEVASSVAHQKHNGKWLNTDTINYIIYESLKRAGEDMLLPYYDYDTNLTNFHDAWGVMIRKITEWNVRFETSALKRSKEVTKYYLDKVENLRR